jgi:hypothetical protein
MTVKVTVESNMNRNVNKAVDMYDENTTRHLNRVANHLKNQILKGMQGTPRDGRTYKRGGKTHTASSKDNPPAIDTGRLVNSFFVRPATRLKNMSAVETRVSYASLLEQSFARGGLQRPFMGKESDAFKNSKQYANTIAKDIKLNKVKIT